MAWKGWTKEQVDAYPYHLRVRARWAFVEWLVWMRELNGGRGT